MFVRVDAKIHETVLIKKHNPQLNKQLNIRFAEANAARDITCKLLEVFLRIRL